MFKNILRLFLIVFFVATLNRANSAVDPKLSNNEGKAIEGDSLTVDSKKEVLKSSEVKTSTIPTTNKKTTESFFDSNSEEVEEDSTSALSFNFIYYIIEKFKFQVE